jgi:dTDP-L-rhamnose 4-epimerase
MKNYLITGGAGFIGCATTRALLRDDPHCNIVIVDNLHPQVHREQVRPSDLDQRAELLVADITDADCWRTLLDRFHPDHIYHLAAETGTGQSLTESTRHAMVNVVGTTRMLDAISATRSFPTSIILPSSRAVYGEGAWTDANGRHHYPGQRTNAMLQHGQWDFAGLSPLAFSAASTIPNPASIYGSTKLAQEQILRNWCLAFDVGAKILRLQNVYGPGQSLHNSYTGILSLFCRQAKAGDTIQLYEDGQMIRDFVYIDDVADAFVRAADAKEKNFTIDIGAGTGTTIAEAANIIASIYDAPAPQVCGKYRNGDVRHAWSDPSSAADLVGWAAEIPPREGISRLCKWIDGRL